MVTTRTKDEIVTQYRIETILDATMRVIAREGMAGASMKAIADEAGVAKGTIYLYFKDREVLLERVADAAFTELLAQLDGAFGQPEAPFAARFALLVERLFHFFEARRDFFRLLLQVCYHQSDARAECRRTESPQYQTYLAKLTDLLAGAVAAGEVMPCDPSRLALFVSEGLHAILFRRLREEAPPSAEAEIAWLTRALLAGITLEKESP
jgi:AcrR family transcriptional regulator